MNCVIDIFLYYVIMNYIITGGRGYSCLFMYIIVYISVIGIHKFNHEVYITVTF